MLIPVFQDEIAARMQQIQRKDLVRKPVQPVQGIGRIGKDQVELLVTDGQEIEDIVPHHGYGIQPQARSFLLDERGVLAGHLHAVHAPGPARSELEGDGTGAPEKVQHLEVLEFILVVQNVEQALLGKVRGGPGLVAGRRKDHFPFQFSADDSHSWTTDLK